MRAAAIDVGTNTIRLLIADYESGEVVPVLRDREIIGLGRNLKNTGEIGLEELERATSVLARFRSEMERSEVDVYFAAGTQALREARNASWFMDEVDKMARVKVRVISPEQEAMLTRDGIKSALDPKTVEGSLMVDIGGGSTEFILTRRNRVKFETTSLGVVYLQSLFPVSEPPEEWEVLNLRLYVRSRLEEVKRRLGVKKVRRIIGTAGTYTTLAAMKLELERYSPEAINGIRLDVGEMEGLEERILSSTSEERLGMKGMERGRERLIVPGIVVAMEAVKTFGAEETVVSDGSILEGMIISLGNNKLKGVKI